MCSFVFLPLFNPSLNPTQGSLPVVLMFDLAGGALVDMVEVSQMMQMLDVQIVLKNCRMNGCRPVVVKAAERNVGEWKKGDRKERSNEDKDLF